MEVKYIKVQPAQDLSGCEIKQFKCCRQLDTMISSQHNISHLKASICECVFKKEQYDTTKSYSLCIYYSILYLDILNAVLITNQKTIRCKVKTILKRNRLVAVCSKPISNVLYRFNMFYYYIVHSPTVQFFSFLFYSCPTDCIRIMLCSTIGISSTVLL